jgi:VanZ family protein
MVASLLPAPPNIGVGDKSGHLLVYFVLSAWFSLIARNRVVLACSLLGLVLFGMLIEWLQGLTGYRYAEWGDVLANSLGCALGASGYLPPLRRLFAAFDLRLAAHTTWRR